MIIAVTFTSMKKLKLKTEFNPKNMKLDLQKSAKRTYLIKIESAANLKEKSTTESQNSSKKDNDSTKEKKKNDKKSNKKKEKKDKK